MKVQNESEKQYLKLVFFDSTAAESQSLKNKFYLENIDPT